MPAKQPTPPPLAFGKLLARALAAKVLPRPASGTPIKSTQPLHH